MHTILQMVDAIDMPLITYACEGWKTNKEETTKLQRCLMMQWNRKSINRIHNNKKLLQAKRNERRIVNQGCHMQRKQQVEHKDKRTNKNNFM